MSGSRERMDKALKEIVLPFLRKKGFKGSFNHFRRVNDDSIDLLTFWFSHYGGEFCIDIAKCSAKGIKDVSGNNILPNKVTAFDINPPERPRLKPDMSRHGDHWFNFGDLFKQHGEIRSPEEIAEEVITLVNNQAEKWWSDKNNITKHSL